MGLTILALGLAVLMAMSGIVACFGAVSIPFAAAISVLLRSRPFEVTSFRQAKPIADRYREFRLEFGAVSLVMTWKRDRFAATRQ